MVDLPRAPSASRWLCPAEWLRAKPHRRGRIRDNASGMTEPRLSVREILHPRAVAVFGASEDRGKFGGRITYFLGHHGFTGRIVPVNLHGGQIRGHTAYRRLVDAPGRVDVAILALPPRHIPAAIADCVAAGVGCCVIITTGFAE